MYPFIKDMIFVVAPSVQVWGKPPPIPDEPENKKRFGIELAKSLKPFDAANVVFPDDVRIALWVSQNWLNDPIVVAAKDLYGETVKLNTPILDKEQLASRVLEEADDLPEGKDRIAALKLYAEIAGYIGKVDIDASTKNYTHNQMTIKLVKPSNGPIIDLPNDNIETKTIKQTEAPFKIKLVKAS